MSAARQYSGQTKRDMNNRIEIAELADLENKKPVHAIARGLDLVIIKFDDDISVLYGRCLHRGALMADATSMERI